MFQVAWDFPSVEPPEYLRRLNPEVYQQECERVAGRFDEAVQLAEAAFIEELQSLVSHLSERLSGQTDGKPKVFRDSAVENLTQFFERFRELNVRSNEQLDELVSHCQHVVAGVEPQASLRDTLGKTSELIVGLKRHRKEAKIVRTTLDSLRQLQTVG